MFWYEKAHLTTLYQYQSVLGKDTTKIRRIQLILL